VAVVAQVAGELDPDAGGPVVVAGPRLDRGDAGERSQPVEHRGVDPGALDDGDDLAAAGIEAVEPLVDLRRLEPGRPVEVGVERREQHAGGHQAEDEDGGPGRHHEPRAAQRQGGQMIEHAVDRPPIGPPDRRAGG
jgi:hypothetical protein